VRNRKSIAYVQICGEALAYPTSSVFLQLQYDLPLFASSHAYASPDLLVATGADLVACGWQLHDQGRPADPLPIEPHVARWNRGDSQGPQRFGRHWLRRARRRIVCRFACTARS
jgi:hypothetical protein